MVQMPGLSKDKDNSSENNLLNGDKNSNGASTSEKSVRKKWSIHASEPQLLMKQLRSQLAEDGCPESQFYLAKTLLENTEDSDNDTHKEEAVFWLCRASSQGCVEATDLLNDCFNRSDGISDQNYDEVKKCLQADQDINLANVASQRLFQSISKGNEFVGDRALHDKIICILSHNETEHKESHPDHINLETKATDAVLVNRSYNRLREGDVIDLSSLWVTGDFPDEAPFVRTLNDSWRFRQLVRRSSNSGFRSNLSFGWWRFYSTLLHFLRSSALGRSNEASFAAGFCGLVVCAGSFGAQIALSILWLGVYLAMTFVVVVSISRIYNEHVFNSFGVALRHFCPQIKLQAALVKHKKKSVQYYCLYFGLLLVYLLLRPVILEEVRLFVTPFLVFVSGILFMSLFEGDNCLYNVIVCLLYMLTRFSQTNVQLWISDGLSYLKPYITEQAISIGDVLYLNMDSLSILHCLWFASVMFGSVRLGLKGLLNHLLCATWFQATFVALAEPWPFQAMGLWAQIPATIVLCAVFLLPKNIFAAWRILPGLLLGLRLFVGGFSISTCFLAFVLTAIAINYIFSSIHFSFSIFKRSEFSVAVISAVFLFLLISPTRYESSGPSQFGSELLQWEEFHKVCFPTSQETSGIVFSYARRTRDCSSLRGLEVHWEANVKKVDAELIRNPAHELVAHIWPRWLQVKLRCLLGRPLPECVKEEKDSEAWERCVFIRAKTDHDCSLDHWNEYGFRIIVSMGNKDFWPGSSGPELTLKAGHEFSRVAFALTANDRVSFSAVLLDGIGTASPRFLLMSISGEEVEDTKRELSFASVDWNIVSHSVKLTFNFIFGPTLTLI